MGKKDHGRLLHEIRDALISSGFEPTQITTLESSEGKRALRSPGFKVEKHTDSKSVRLSHKTAQQPPSSEEMDWETRQAEGSALMTKLIRYNAALERAGFICIAIDSRDTFAPYSLWRRGAKPIESGSEIHDR